MLRLGPIQLQTNLLLAPIAGYCDLAFRTICREASFIGGARGGVGLACTDLLSPQGLLRGTATSLDLAQTNEFDRPVGMQLYGSDPELMAEGARWAVEHGAAVVDINMGCPVDKVTKKDGGSKLLTDLPRAAAIVARVVKELERCALSRDEWKSRLGDAALIPEGVEVARCQGANGHMALDTLTPRHLGTSFPVPLTVKMRLCWHTQDYLDGRACSPDLARALADAGVVAVTVHGRTTEMKFSGEVQRAGIARVVESVDGRIPVIGNGDVREPGDVPAMLRATGCSGVMIGRGALSTPWIFRDAWALQTTGSIPPAPSVAEKIGLVRRFFDLMRTHHDDRYALFQINRRISWFAKRLTETRPDGSHVGVKPFKEAVRLAKTCREVYGALDCFLAGGLRGGAPEAQEAAA